MTRFDLPPGDPHAIRAAATALAAQESHLAGWIKPLQGGFTTALDGWEGPNAVAFSGAADGVIGTATRGHTSIAGAVKALRTYATVLENARTRIQQLNHQADEADRKATADTKKATDSSMIGSIWEQALGLVSGLGDQAEQHRADVRRAARVAAAALDMLTASALPITSAPTPEQMRMVLQALKDAPAPGTAGFEAWLAGLGPLERQVYLLQLGGSMPGADFDPWASIQPGEMPAWAQAFNDSHIFSCVRPTSGANPFLPSPGNVWGSGYGYFGGGSIQGPGGGQWPIVAPMYSDGSHYFFDDRGPGPNGGINQLDGNDPGWTTIGDWHGLAPYGTVSLATTGAALMSGLSTNPNYPKSIRMQNGRPVPAGGLPTDPGEPEEGDRPVTVPRFEKDPKTGQVGVVEVEPEMPKVMDAYDKANTLLGAAEHVYTTVHDLNSHAERQWDVQYQVNDDGRIRAVVRTFSAYQDEDGTMQVVGAAHGFKDGNGSTDEHQFDVRDNMQHVPQAGPKGWNFQGETSAVPNVAPFHENLNR